MDNVNMGGGSELHRLKPLEEYNEQRFNRLYKQILPYIKKLSIQIDHRRYNVSRDIIQSYFIDKFMFVFGKYQNEYDDTHLKASIISSLSTYKNRLLRNAYTEQSEYYQSLNSLEELFDDSKELLDVEEEEMIKEERFNQLYSYMKRNLTPDAYLVFEVTYCPPPYIRSRLKSDNSKISAMLLIDFFDIPRTKTSSNYISRLRQEIDYYIERAKIELPG